ncbi:MAG: hypothetical protein V4598_17010 [Bdellovibrionota bacterium]
METKISIIQFLFSYNWKVLSDSLGANPALVAHRFSNASDILKFCSTEENCLVIANISSKDDLIQLATFVKTSRRSLKGTVIKIVVVNATENKQFERAINKIGSIEILEPSVNVKALRFKMDFWMKAMRGQAKKLGAMSQKTLEQTTALEGAADSKTVKILPPLDCESDIWILSRETDCKKIISRWMVKLMGPSPYVATWNDVPGKPNVWAFQIKKSFQDMFISGEGTWFFKGDQKPEFNWQENRWMFTGENLELFFHDTKEYSRLKIENRGLTLTGNSLFAKTKESLITDSFNKDLVFKNEAELLKGQSLDFENEGDLGGNIQGKVKEKSEAGKGYLEGKIKDQEVSAKGNLEGKIKDQEVSAKGNLSGKVKDKEEQASGPMSGKLTGKEDSQNDLKGKLKDKEEEKKGHLSGKLTPEEVKAAEQKKHAQTNDDISTSWNGKVAQEKSAEKEEKDHKQHNDKIAANYGGKVAKEEYDKSGSPDLRGKSDSADRLNSNWGGKNTSDSLQTDGLSAPGNEGVKEGSLLDLKKSEHEHQTHYKNHNEATKYEADETRKNQYQNEDGSDLGGKTSTDKLATHLGRKNSQLADGKEAPEKKRSPFADMPKGKAEKISSHFVGSKRKPVEKKNKSGLDFDLDSDSQSQESSDPIDELEMLELDSADADNVLPFFEKSKESDDVEKLTAPSIMTSFIVQNGQKYECSMDDYFDSNVILVCKGEGLTNSVKAVLDIKLDYKSDQAQINCECMVMSIDQDGNGGFFVTVEVSPEDARKFDKLMNLLKSRQENIDTFLMKVKGY